MKKSKHILLVTSEFPPQPGGIGNHAFNVADQLQVQGCFVTVITDIRSTDGTDEKRFDATLNFKVIRIQRYKFIFYTYIKRLLIYKNFLNSNNVSTIIASGKFSLWLVSYGKKLTKSSERFSIIHGSEVNLKKWITKAITEGSLKKFNGVIAVSNYTKSLVEHLKLRNVSAISNGFNQENFNEEILGINIKGRPSLLTVGNVSQRKGQHNVIEKLSELRVHFPEIHYHMVGIPSDKENLVKLATDLNVQDLISFHGILDQKGLVSILKESDIFVMLSEETSVGDVEGFGIALIEANYMKVPTIGSNTSGIVDAISNYKSGILIDPKNTAEMIDAINEIMRSKEKYIAEAYDWALLHTWDTVIHKYLKFMNL